MSSGSWGRLLRSNEISSNLAMVEELEATGQLTDPICVAAMRKIDRKHFWVEGSGDVAYADMPLRHGKLHQSAPHIYARVLEALMPLQRGMSFLNVGSGTGYFSCLVSEIIGDAAVNDGVDIWPENVAHSQDRCRRIGKTGIEFTHGNVYQLDVHQGMRYDRIYVGACANSRSKYLYELLEVGGVLVGPFQSGATTQQLRRVVRKTESHFAVEVLSSVQFANLVEPLTTFSQQLSRLRPSVPSSQILCLPGVPFTFAVRERPWAPERALFYPVAYRRIVGTMLFGRPDHEFAICLPPEVWIEHILPWCPRRWFDSPRASASMSPSPGLSAALAFAGEAVKRNLPRRLRSYSSCSSSSDGDSTCVPDTPSSGRSRCGSTDSIEEGGNVPDAPELLFEAYSNGERHIIGSSHDPDDLVPTDVVLEGTRVHNVEEVAEFGEFARTNRLSTRLHNLRRFAGRCIVAHCPVRCSPSSANNENLRDSSLWRRLHSQAVIVIGPHRMEALLKRWLPNLQRA